MENIETINEFLRNQYGIDTDDSEPIFRVVWSEDQTEHRVCQFTESGMQLITPEVRLVKKYNYLSNLYVLERRVLVPEINQKELCGLKKSYEPLWVFHDRHGNPVRPTIQGCQFVVDAVYAALGKRGLKKYVDPLFGKTQEELVAEKEQRIDQIEADLFGDESGLLGDTVTESGSTIIVPKNYDSVKH
jgi:hypothetical protein